MTARAARRRAAAVAALALLLALAAAPAARAGARTTPTMLIVPPEKHTLGIYRATDLHLKLFTGPKSRFRNPQGLACVKLARLDDPARIGDDDELTVYGVNADEPSIIYNDSMTSVKIWRGPMRAPRGIAADPFGRVVVADTGNDRLLLLENDRGELELRRTVGSRGSGAGEFREPTGVALDARGRIYVADTGNDRVQILDRTGAFVSQFGGATDGSGTQALVAPTAIAAVDRAEPWAFRKADRVVVVDRGGRRLQVFAPDGVRLHAFADTTRDGLSFAYVALDYHDNVYATDTRRCQIHKFDASLRLIASFGRRGDGDGEFESPTGIAVWRRLGQFFIAEATGAQYYWLGTDILGVTARPLLLAPGGTQVVAYSVTERSIVDIDLLDRDDRVVKAIARQAYQEVGEQRMTWEARSSDSGDALPPGEYRVRIGAVATYSSRKHFRCERSVPIVVRADGAGS